MTIPNDNPAAGVDSYPTVKTPLPSPPVDDRPTIDLRITRPDQQSRETVEQPIIDLRDTALVPAQGGPPVPAPEPVELLRFGPGVPAVIAEVTIAATAPSAPAAAEKPQRLRRGRVLNLALTLALAAVVVWLLWPSGSLHVRGVSVRATPGVVTCEQSADVVATVRTNGNAGRISYRWTRNDGVGSGTLVQSLARGQRTVNLHLAWAFRGPGTYHARATVQLLSAGGPSATVNFRYVC
jgi:hypothetical protein